MSSFRLVQRIRERKMKGIKMRNAKGMRRSAALVFALLLLFCQAIPAFAEEQSDPDMEYEMAVAEIIRDYRHDPEGVVRRLAALDTELVGEPAVKEHHTAPENAARKTTINVCSPIK